MKIILCTFLLCITTVSVFGQSVELNGTLGKSIEFPAAVKKGGSLMHSSVIIGEVASSSFGTPRNENYRDRLQWDSSTGLFSLSGLKMEDIGEYKVQNTDQNINTVFQLNVHVFGKVLNGTLEKNIEIPAAVKKRGFLTHSSVLIGDVTSGRFTAPPNEKHRDRVHWDSSTGFFSLSRLKMEDSGEYKVQNIDQDINTVFQLHVREDNVPVSKPNVSITHNEYPCTIECTANRGTLSWYRKGQKKSFASSHGESAPHLNMMVESGTYTCEANNSFSNKTSDPLTVGAHCTDPIKWILIAVVVLLFLAIVTYFLWRRFCRNRKEIRGKFIYRPEPTEKMTSHQTEVPLNQATEVGEP